MFDIGWSEILLIGVVALVVIGPKDLPGALRGLGRMVTKARRTIGEFQGQFNEALKEANLEDVKKEFDSIRQSTSVLRTGFNPAAMVRNEMKSAVEGPSARPMSLPSASSGVMEGSTPVQMIGTSAQGDEAGMDESGLAVVIPSAFAPLPMFRRA